MAVAPEDPGGHPPFAVRRPRRAALGVVYFTVFLDLLGFGIILPFLPFFALELGASGLGLGVILTSYSLAQLAGALVLGRLSDRWGRRPVLMLSLAGAAAAMAMSGLAASLAALASARALAGLFGGSISTAQAYVADVTSSGERARFMGFLGAAIGFGFVVGPALGVALHRLGLGFAGVAFTAAGLAAANLVLAAFLLTESKPAGAPPPRRSLTEDWRAAARPGVREVLAATFLTTFAFVAMETTFALFGEERFGMDEKGFGLALVWVGVVMIAVQGGLIGPVTRRFGVRAAAVAGGLLMAAALGLLPWCPSLFWALAVLGGLAAGQGLTVPTHATLISHAGGAGEQGALLGARQSFAAAARAVGPLAAGTLYDLHNASPFLTGGALAAVAGLLVAASGARERRAPCRSTSPATNTKRSNG
jgi:DHA1 family tetracycline resistance protein-like MFS transporter